MMVPWQLEAVNDDTVATEGWGIGYCRGLYEE